jgi:hypothetical protein
LPREGDGIPAFFGILGPGRGWGKQATVDVGTHIESRLLSRRLTDGDAASHLPIAAAAGSLAFDLFDVGKIFKKTPYVADSQRPGRDLAKDMIEVEFAPDGAIAKAAGMSHVEFTGPVRRLISAQEARDSVARRGDIQATAQILNVKLTGTSRAARPTKWRPDETNPTSGEVRTDARQAGSAIISAVTRGGSPESQCDAVI